MIGAIPVFGPAAMICDFTYAIERGHGVDDALGFDGLLGKPTKP